MKKDAYYFPHFSNARHDRKIQRLRKELGIEGYGIYFMLLETLRDQHDLSFPMKDLDLLAHEFGTSEQKIRVTICNYGLFEIDLQEQFFSPKMLVFLEPYFKGKEQRKKAVEARWMKFEQSKLSENQKDNTAVLRPNNDRNTVVIQSKVKESKVKESKIDNTDNSVFSFEEFWSLYPHKKERKDCEKKWGTLTNEQKEKIKNTLPDFLKYKPFESYTHPNPKTYLNKQRWDDEIPMVQNQQANKVQTPYQLEAEMWTKYTKEQIDIVHKHFYAQMELPLWFDRKYEEVANPDRRR